MHKNKLILDHIKATSTPIRPRSARMEALQWRIPDRNGENLEFFLLAAVACAIVYLEVVGTRRRGLASPSDGAAKAELEGIVEASR